MSKLNQEVLLELERLEKERQKNPAGFGLEVRITVAVDWPLSVVPTSHEFVP